MQFRKMLRSIGIQLGVDAHFRQVFVEANLIGERLLFAIRGRPAPSSAIILAGSGRSGTTWLSNVLTSIPGVQQIFEPLYPPWSEDVRRLTGWDSADPYIRLWYLRPTELHPEWEDYWRRVLTGRIRNYWTDYDRTSYFPNRYFVKEIRANLMLGYVYDRFQSNIIYLIRHPCAVVHSRLSVASIWHADVRDILRQEQLVEDHLRPYLKWIEQEKDLLGVHAVWWAVENRIAKHDLATRPHIDVTYESLVLEPEFQSQMILKWLGYEHISPKIQRMIQLPSRMTRPGFASAVDRLSKWKQDLSADDQQRILTWARRLEIEDYDEDTVPVCVRTTQRRQVVGVVKV